MGLLMKLLSRFPDRSSSCILGLAALMFGCSGCTDVADREPARCELVLEMPSTLKQAEILSQVRVQIRNLGKSDVTLVMPGDGSECAWRTPIVGWSILPLDSSESHPASAKRTPTGRCGNISGLRPEEVFTLKPGESKSLGEWHAFPPQLPGKYRVMFYYENRPGIDWKGLPLADHDEDAMAAVADSHAVSVASDEVIVEITE